MPTYEYQCEKCGLIEIWQSIKDNALTVCPTCGSKVERQISANVGFVFKGSGFYQNEYKTQPKSSEAISSTDSKGSPQAASGQVLKDSAKVESKTSEKTLLSPLTSSVPAPVSGTGSGTSVVQAPAIQKINKGE